MKHRSILVAALLSIALLAACSVNSSRSLTLIPTSTSDERASKAPNATTPRSAEVRHTDSFKSLFSFDSTDGANPLATLTYVNGFLYGTTEEGGFQNGGGGGTAFRITPSGSEKVLHAFGNAGDGAIPTARLRYFKGALYGTTSQGGDATFGTVFRITPSGAEKMLYSFKSVNDGEDPWAGLTDVNGLLYGTTVFGGSHYEGTVFTITTSGLERVIYSFKGQRSDGHHPIGDLIDVDGILYGTTRGGGSGCYGGCGTVYSITTSGAEKVLYSFKGGNAADGSEPLSSLTYLNGMFYGTTYKGGSYDRGTVFTITTTGTENVLYNFKGGSDGEWPWAGLIDVNGKLYGTTQAGGEDNDGTVFKITPSGSETVIHRFDGTEGDAVRAGLTYVNGVLYGTTQLGGASGYGTVFSLMP